MAQPLDVSQLAQPPCAAGSLPRGTREASPYPGSQGARGHTAMRLLWVRSPGPHPAHMGPGEQLMVRRRHKRLNAFSALAWGGGVHPAPFRGRVPSGLQALESLQVCSAWGCLPREFSGSCERCPSSRQWWPHDGLTPPCHPPPGVHLLLAVTPAPSCAVRGSGACTTSPAAPRGPDTCPSALVLLGQDGVHFSTFRSF